MKPNSLRASLGAVFAETGSSNADRRRSLSAGIFAFSLPLAPAALPLLMVVVIAAQLIDRDVWRTRPLLRMDPFSPALWSVLLLLLHVIGMAWTSNTDFGWFDVGIKLPLLALPMLAFLPGLNNKGRDAVLLSFCLGNMVAVFVCIALATTRALTADGLGIQEFISSTFSAVMHPSYFAWYLSVALACFYMGGLKDRVPRWLGLAFVLILCIGVVLTGSRMGWITLPLVLCWSLWCAGRDRWTRNSLLAIIMFSVLAGGVLTGVSEHVRFRVMELFGSEERGVADPFSSAAVRTVTWNAALDIGCSNMPLGTGTGDVKDELLLRYKEVGATHAFERKLNAHSQFLQSFAALGLAGITTIVLMVLLPMIGAIRDRRSGALHACVLVLLALNLNVESMLEVQAGALFTGWIFWTLWWPASPMASSPP